MESNFKIELKKFVDNPKQYSYLIAASGGLDSTVLINLCQELKLDFGICHCNFGLRNQDSDDDQKHLENLSEEINKPIYILAENAKVYAKTHHLTTQEAARIIRYNWFETCLKKYGYTHLITAHHADDNLETFLINSLRGTGIKGLTGIPSQRDYIIRPMLSFSREQILDYAIKKNIRWRDDVSNASDNYLRNVIRHHLIPFFKKRGDNMHARFETTLRNTNRQSELLEDYMHIVFKQVIEEKENSYKIKLKALGELPNSKYILIELLRDFGFKDWESVYSLTTAQVGKFVTSSSHKLVKERGYLELFAFEEKPNQYVKVSIHSLPKNVSFGQGFLKFEDAKSLQKTDSNTAFISKDLIKSDFILRPYQKGDYFYPLGMNGKRKLSDFLKDEKLSTLEKSKVWVLTHQNDIVWVINHRIDNRYKITDNTKQCLKIQYYPY